MHLINFCIYDGFGAHAAIMLLTALWDLALECQHLMPYGDVPVLLGFAGVLGVCKARYLASQKAE